MSEYEYDKIEIQEEMQRSYIDYSMSVIIGRALPDARDGLKPCNRRILFAMHQGSWYHNRPFVKCARVVGDVMGKFHPHGDSAVYETLVRMAQEFSMRCPLIMGQGNFGSVDGDPPAAYRYTECRLQHLAEDMLTDIDKRTVDMRLNYDEKHWEPTVLPTRFPNLLVNGSTGIAVGMATNIPPHNLEEIIDGIVHLIDHPDAEIGDLMHFVKGPDFPTGGQIVGASSIKKMYETGRGIIRMRGLAEIEVNEKSKDRIIINEIPYAVNKATMIMRMAELVNGKQIEGISDIRDESNKDGIRVVIELKRGAMGQVVLNNLYKQTALQSSFGAIMLALDKNRPKVMNLKELMTCFIDHRYDVVTRKAEFELEKAEARAHILEGLLIALEHMDDVVKIIRASNSRDIAREQLIEKFKLTEIQTNAILDMRLYQLTGLEREKIEAEYKKILESIEELKAFLASDELKFAAIKDDLANIRETYGTPRKTELTIDEDDVDIEDLIEDRPVVITISHAGYIKRVPLETYKEQRRGGKGVKGMKTKDEDFVEEVFLASTHDYILFFTGAGRIYWKKVYQIPEGGRTARGKALVNLLEVGADEKIAAMIRARDFSEDEHLVMATRNGVVKKTNLSAFKNVRAGGIIAISIDEGDQLIGVKKTGGDDNVMLITRQGMSIRFHENQLRDQGRATRGVRGITLGKKGDAVQGLDVVDNEATLLVATENGFGKRTDFTEYNAQKRGGKGVITIKTTDRNGEVVGAHAVKSDDALMLITEKGQMVRIGIDSLRTMGRNTQGVTLIKLSNEDRLVSVAPIKSGPDEMADDETSDVPAVEGEAPAVEGEAPASDTPDAPESSGKN